MKRIAILGLLLGVSCLSVAGEVFIKIPENLSDFVPDKKAVFQYDRGALTWSALYDYEVAARTVPARSLSNAYLLAEYRANPKAFDSDASLRIARQAESGLRRIYGDLKGRDHAAIRESLSNVAALALKPQPTPDSVLTLGKEALAQFQRENAKWEEAMAMAAVARRLGVSLTGASDPISLTHSLGFSSYDFAEKAIADGRFARALDRLNADLGLPSVLDSPFIMKTKSPKAYQLVAIDEVFEETKGSRTDIYRLQKAAERMAVRANRKLAALGEKIDRLAIQEAQRELTAEARARQAETENEIRETYAAVGSGARLLTMLAGRLDPQAGRVLRVTLEPAIRLMAGIALVKIGALSTAGFVGLAIAVVTEILDALLGGPSDTQLILEALAQLRREVAELKRDLFEALGRIDQKINIMFVTVLERFDAVEELVRSEFRDVKTSLSRLERQSSVSDRRLNAIEEVFRKADENRYRIDLRRRLNYCLPPGKVDIGRETYRSCINDFYTCASEDALEPLFTGPVFKTAIPLGVKGADDVDALDFHVAVEALLADDATSLWNRMALLEDVARARFGWRLVGEKGTLANVMTWSLCARAYADMAVRWPHHYREALRAGYTAGPVEKPGLDARRALRRIVFPDDKHGVSDRGLLQLLLREYRGRAEALAAYAESRRHSFERDKLKGVSLAAGLKQSVPPPKYVHPGKVVPMVYSGLGESEGHPTLQLSQARNIALSYPSDESLLKGVPRAIQLAHHLGLGTVKIVQEASLSPMRPDRKVTRNGVTSSSDFFRRDFDWSIEVHCVHYGKAQLNVRVIFDVNGGTTHVLRSKAFAGAEKAWWEYHVSGILSRYGKEYLRKDRSEKILTQLAEEIAARWDEKDGFRTQLEQELIAQPVVADEAVKAAETLVTEYLQRATADLQKQLTEEAKQGQLELNRHLRAISGARRLLEAYLRIGLPATFQGKTTEEKTFHAALAQLPDGGHSLLAAQRKPVGGGFPWFRTAFPAGATVSDEFLARSDTFEKALEALPLAAPESHPILDETLHRLVPLTARGGTP